MKKIISLVVLVVMLTLSIFSTVVNASKEPEKHDKARKHFVLVHGGWQGAWCWYKIEDKLKDKGCKVTVLDLPAHGKDKTDPMAVTLKDYEDKVTGVLDSIHEDVILVGHGTLAPVISMAAEARPEKVEKLIYIAGVLVTDGQTLDQALFPNDELSLAAKNSIIDPEKGIITLSADALDEAVYGMSSKKDIKLAKKLFCHEPLFPLLTPITLTDSKYGKIPRYYIKTLQDKAVATEYQEMMLKLVPCKKVFSIKSDHAPFFSKPEELTKILLDVANDKKSRK